MDLNADALRDVKGDYNMRGCLVPNTLRRSDIVAGNRYAEADGTTADSDGCRLVPDPNGPWLALVTHRGEKAPPRPATLPVGTRVRRGPDWRWNDQDGKPGNVGTVVSGLGAWYYVQWDGCEDCKCAYRWYSSASGDCYDLEVVSLPAEKPAKPAPKTWPDEAVLVDDTDTDGQRRWFDALGNHHCKAGAPKLVEPAAATLRRSFLTRGIRYDIAAVDQAKEDPNGWLCVRDFTGKDWRPSGSDDKSPATDTPAFKVGDRVRLRLLPGWRNPEWKRLDVRDATTLPRHHRVMLDRLRAAGWIVTESENIDVAESGMATRGDTRILITPDAIRVHPKKPAGDGHVGVSLDYAREQAAAVLEAADIIDTVRSEWRRASEWGAVHPVTTEPARRIIPVEGFHDMEHLLEDAEPAGIVPRPSR